MKQFKIIIDSTFYLSKEEIERYNISVASLLVVDGDSSYKETELTNDFIYDELSKGKKLTTSQPPPQTFLSLYKKAIEEDYETIFVLTLAPPLSGTYQSAKIAIDLLEEKDKNKIHLFTSRLAAVGNEMLALELAAMINDSHDKQTIINRMEKLISTGQTNFTIENLIHLMRSGRLSKTKAVIGTALRIKPLLMQDKTGRLILQKSARTHKKVMEMIINNIKNTTKDKKQIIIRLVSKNQDNYMHILKKLIENNFPTAKISISYYVGPIFTLHLGANAYGLAWCSE